MDVLRTCMDDATEAVTAAADAEVWERLEEIAMPGGKTPGPSVKRPAVYEALKAKGMSKEKAAKISNSEAAGKRKKGK